jgi:hypothetical protein
MYNILVIPFFIVYIILYWLSKKYWVYISLKKRIYIFIIIFPIYANINIVLYLSIIN